MVSGPRASLRWASGLVVLIAPQLLTAHGTGRRTVAAAVGIARRQRHVRSGKRAGVVRCHEARARAANLRTGPFVLATDRVHAPRAATGPVAAGGCAVLIAANLLARAEVGAVGLSPSGERLAEPATKDAAVLRAVTPGLVRSASRAGRHYYCGSNVGPGAGGARTAAACICGARAAAACGSCTGRLRPRLRRCRHCSEFARAGAVTRRNAGVGCSAERVIREADLTSRSFELPPERVRPPSAAAGPVAASRRAFPLAPLLLARAEVRAVVRMSRGGGLAEPATPRAAAQRATDLGLVGLANRARGKQRCWRKCCGGAVRTASGAGDACSWAVARTLSAGVGARRGAVARTNFAACAHGFRWLRTLDGSLGCFCGLRGPAGIIGASGGVVCARCGFGCA